MTTPIFLRLSDRIINLAHVVDVEQREVGALAVRLTALWAGELDKSSVSTELEYDGPDAALLRQALDSFAWRPTGGPGPPGVEALRLCEKAHMVLCDLGAELSPHSHYGSYFNGKEGHGRQLILELETLLARAAAAEGQGGDGR